MKTHTLIFAALILVACQEKKCLDDTYIHNPPPTEGESVDSVLMKRCQESGVDYNTIGTTTDPEY